ncbi:MAG: transketolase [Planctomycetes bacterium]|nr:transketolase [Planctomycetota bacterium]
MAGTGFSAPALTPEQIARLAELGRVCRGDILKMTELATCGHPGGSMSSLDFYLVVWSLANVDPRNPQDPDRDRIVVSHGHTSPGVYSVLGRLGFFPIDEAVAHFRQSGSIFEGHVERSVPGVQWSTGNLGQGLSAAAGMAMAARLTGRSYHVFAMMSDGEQAKGQVAEARRFIRKYNLANVTVLLDLNYLQISGRATDIMPVNYKDLILADGWRVLEVDGHDYQAIYQAVREAVHDQANPVAILCRTIMGKGVPAIEDKEKWHGAALPKDLFEEALKVLGIENDLPRYAELRKAGPGMRSPIDLSHQPAAIDLGTPRTYTAPIDNRSAWGAALADLAKLNGQKVPMACVDCDLVPSVRTGDFQKALPNNFLQVGVQEHNAATISGALSVSGVLTYFSDFGVFGFDETYNQHRLNDINETNLKLVCTHCGLDVGEDGKTHQCLDYVGVMRNLYGFKLIVPADGNQTDRAVRYLSREPGNFAVAVGRSKLPIVTTEAGQPFFADGYAFEYGKADWIRRGAQATVIAMGTMVPYCLGAVESLRKEGLGVGLLGMSCPKDPDMAAIREAAKTGVIVTCEDHNVWTGLGASVAEALALGGIACKLEMLGVRRYASSGTPDDLYAEQGIDPASVVAAVKRLTKAP